MIKENDTIFPQPFYYIIFSIGKEDETESQFQSLFSNEKGSLKYFLEHEAHGFRWGGWDLPKNTQYTTQLESLEYKDSVRRIKILENGHIIIQASVSEEFLCWANSNTQSTKKGNRIQINTTALIEFTYNSVALLKRALKDMEDPKYVICTFGFIGMDDNYVLGNAKLPNQFAISFEMNPIGINTESSIKINQVDLSKEDDVAKISYAILVRVFRMFGFTEDIISYVKKDKKEIDVELIKNIQ
ncbi:MAG: hypothetical protein ABSE68_01370 [Minisyncoccia bacterium]